MSERLTSRNNKGELLFNNIRVIAGEHYPAYRELENAEMIIAEMKTEITYLTESRKCVRSSTVGVAHNRCCTH